MKRYALDEVMIAVVVAVLLCVLSYQLITDRSVKRGCRASGGKVEHYDLKHEDYWSCVKSREERAP